MKKHGIFILLITFIYALAGCSAWEKMMTRDEKIDLIINEIQGLKNQAIQNQEKIVDLQYQLEREKKVNIYNTYESVIAHRTLVEKEYRVVSQKHGAVFEDGVMVKNSEEEIRVYMHKQNPNEFILEFKDGSRTIFYPFAISEVLKNQ